MMVVPCFPLQSAGCSAIVLAGFWGQFGGSPAVGYNPRAGWLVSAMPSACHYRFQTSGTQPRLSPGKAQAGKS